jgi:drug/metabolite transporter (DMT)-like permease
MMWLMLSLVAALLFAVTNVIDKHLISRKLPEASAGAMTILAGFVSLPFLALFGWLARAGLARYDPYHAAGALAAGLLLEGAIYCYYRALTVGETATW